MKIFQVIENFCHWDATSSFPTLESLEGKFGDECHFVEAPDYVMEGWGYVEGELIKPEAPEGFEYDEASGTFHIEGLDCHPGGGGSRPSGKGGSELAKELCETVTKAQENEVE